MASAAGAGGTPLRGPCPLSAWPDVPSMSIMGTEDQSLGQEWSREVAADRLGVEAIELVGEQPLAIPLTAERGRGPPDRSLERRRPGGWALLTSPSDRRHDDRNLLPAAVPPAPGDDGRVQPVLLANDRLELLEVSEHRGRCVFDPAASDRLRNASMCAARGVHVDLAKLFSR